MTSRPLLPNEDESLDLDYRESLIAAAQLQWPDKKISDFEFDPKYTAFPPLLHGLCYKNIGPAFDENGKPTHPEIPLSESDKRDPFIAKLYGLTS